MAASSKSLASTRNLGRRFNCGEHMVCSGSDKMLHWAWGIRVSVSGVILRTSHTPPGLEQALGTALISYCCVLLGKSSTEFKGYATFAEEFQK